MASHLNVEFKARCENPEKIRKILVAKGADFKGKDHQIDTYFKIDNGRLKLREGNIENSLIHYNRSDQAGPKQSNVTLFPTLPDTPLKALLTKALGVKVAVDKLREIYFIENVKFHIDYVEKLGSFVEVEAIDLNGSIGKEKLREQCEEFLREFGVRDRDLISKSYSDLLIEED